MMSRKGNMMDALNKVFPRVRVPLEALVQGLFRGLAPV